MNFKDDVIQFHPFTNITLRPQVKISKKRHGVNGIGTRVKRQRKFSMLFKHSSELNSSMIHTALVALLSAMIDYIKEEYKLALSDKITMKIVMKNQKIFYTMCSISNIPLGLLDISRPPKNKSGISRQLTKATEKLWNLPRGVEVEIWSIIDSFQAKYPKLTNSEVERIVKNSKFIVKIEQDSLSMGRGIIVGLAKEKKLSLLLDKLSSEGICTIKERFKASDSKDWPNMWKPIRDDSCEIQRKLAVHLYNKCNINPYNISEFQKAKKFEEELGISLHILDGNNSFNLTYPTQWIESMTPTVYLLRSRNDSDDDDGDSCGFHYDLITSKIIEKFI